ncbi:uncharacterized protein LOC107492594 [Arachis duranensis]|uniref:Uncharacterized protein LOC107492594 n=1 Tax=Arachis duranensis TaxID=130453 RepID=A0A9C6SZW9_ARADU|nr:uncharacterized protein LOC107492594 [Arachis duranensis]
MGLSSRAAAICPSLPSVDLSALLHNARNPCFLLHGRGIKSLSNLVIQLREVCNHPDHLESAFDGSWNQGYKDKQWQKAIGFYSEAIKLSSTTMQHTTVISSKLI